MKYSVIIPSIGKSSYLQSTLASIAAQEVEVELIVVDDAREDVQSQLIQACVAQYPALNARIVQSARRGLCAARNTGLSF